MHATKRNIITTRILPQSSIRMLVFYTPPYLLIVMFPQNHKIYCCSPCPPKAAWVVKAHAILVA